MIPKIIHYCWLSDDPIPKELQDCIDTWHRLLSDYKFIKWDFALFPKGKSKWVDQAFEKKKYAFAADYIRLYALYHYGGIYLDSDVEVLKSFNDFLHLDDMLCYENSSRKGLEVAVIGVSKNRKWVKQCLDYYSNRRFDLGNGMLDIKVLPEVVKDNLIKAKWNIYNVSNIHDASEVNPSNSIPVFPHSFFSPKSYETGELILTENTYSIHHFAASWQGTKEKVYKMLTKIIGKKKAKSFADFIKNMLAKKSCNE